MQKIRPISWNAALTNVNLLQGPNESQQPLASQPSKIPYARPGRLWCLIPNLRKIIVVFVLLIRDIMLGSIIIDIISAGCCMDFKARCLRQAGPGGACLGNPLQPFRPTGATVPETRPRRHVQRVKLHVQRVRTLLSCPPRLQRCDRTLLPTCCTTQHLLGEGCQKTACKMLQHRQGVQGKIRASCILCGGWQDRGRIGIQIRVPVV